MEQSAVGELTCRKEIERSGIDVLAVAGEQGKGNLLLRSNDSGNKCLQICKRALDYQSGFLPNGMRYVNLEQMCMESGLYYKYIRTILCWHK